MAKGEVIAVGVEIKIVKDNTIEVVRLSDKALKKALEEIGLVAERNAKEEITKAVYNQPPAPSGYKRTGNLRNSITHTRDDTAAYIGTNVEYAPYVELGTSRMKARPYLKPAVVNHQDDYRKIIKNNMEDA